MPVVRPFIEDEWGVCAVCGSSFPVSQLRLNRRFGWQCLPNNWKGTSGCWSGTWFRDEQRPPYHPGEGTRRSNAPTVDTTEGIVAGDTIPRVYLQDLVTSGTWRVLFQEEITFEAIASPPYGKPYLRLPGGCLWISGGFMQFDTNVFPGNYVYPPPGPHLAIIGGWLEYVAP